MDRLEEFIRQNREELDQLNPPEEIWLSIRKNSVKRKPFVKWISIAASLIIISGTSLLLMRSGLNKSGSEGFQSLKETEIYYNNLVNSLYTEATPLLSGYPEMKKELTEDITTLDSIFMDIRKDLKDNVANQEVVEALILNYRTRIRILEEMLELLKDNDNPEKKKNYEL
jgi:hypothetical protein